jgi:cytochrome c oxidase cbb3-type subunit 3
VSREEKDKLLGHAADNDGIDEYDNALPDWWLGLFVFTVLWGVGYALDYHFLRPRSQESLYEAEMAAAKERWPEPVAKELAFDEATVQAGAQIFATTCASCHGAELTGGIGPNLVDATWIHGAEPDQVRATISNGVLEKGMPSWGPVLGPDKVAKVAAFIVTKARAAGPAAPATAAAPVPAGGPAPDAVAAAPAAGDPGEQLFRQNCVACHGENLEGKIGPNLTDDEWIHGSALADIERTITNGVPEKGMVSWGPILGPEKVKQVALFVHGKSNGHGER